MVAPVPNIERSSVPTPTRREPIVMSVLVAAGAAASMATLPAGKLFERPWIFGLLLLLGLAVFGWFSMARLVRGQVLQAREYQYVEAARSMGGTTPRILLRHVLPNVLGPVIVVVSFGLGAVAGTEVFLSFLGIGVQPPTPSLGLMIFENASISVLRTNPHLLLFPVGTLTVLLFTFNLLGDAVNDAFNPRAR